MPTRSMMIRKFVCGVAAAGLLVPSAGFAAPIVPATVPTTQAQAAVTDVAVRDGQIVGRVLDAAGQPIVGQTISLSRGGERIGQTVTGPTGRYALAAESGQHYLIAAGTETTVLRTWDAQIAPPAARTDLTLVTSAQSVRGQGCTGCDVGCGECCPQAGGCGAGGGVLGGKAGIVLGGAGLAAAVVVGAIALGDADDAEDSAGDALDKSDANMMQVEAQRQAINETRTRVNTIQDTLQDEDIDDFDDLRDALGDLDDLEPIDGSQSPS